LSAPGRLRIGGGLCRGLKIQAPGGIRPTSGRLREALFNIWADRLEGCRFLDLFAGSGAVGIEAASRGAKQVLLVEGDHGVLAVVEHNRRQAGLAAVRQLQASLPEELARRLRAEEQFELVFADPPYGFSSFYALLAAAEPHLAEDGEIALEHRWRENAPTPPDGLVTERSRRYGDSGLSFYRRPGKPS
jgi:16S rRNA (guanine(966)-N(2))-methyltransferase RsmD